MTPIDLPTSIRVGIFLAKPVAQLVKALRAKAKYPPFGRKNWLNEAADDIVRQCLRDRFIPDAIAPTGMGGLSFAILVAKRFPGPRIEIAYVDRLKRATEHGRETIIRTDHMQVQQGAYKRVLVLAGINATGQTVEGYTNLMAERGAEDVRSAALLESWTTSFRATYRYRQVPIDPEKLRQLPWYEGGQLDWV